MTNANYMITAAIDTQMQTHKQRHAIHNKIGSVGVTLHCGTMFKSPQLS